jgi:hypothetical protein
MVMISTEVHLSGELLTGNPWPAIDEFIEDACEVVAMQGFANVHTNLNLSLRNPTPYYETQIMAERQAADRWLIHDSDVIYGPWLEGTGSRNATTSFKGYASFRRAAQQLEAQVPLLIAPYAELLVRRLGGG